MNIRQRLMLQVLSLQEGQLPQTRNSLLLTKQTSIPSVVRMVTFLGTMKHRKRLLHPLLTAATAGIIAIIIRIIADFPQQQRLSIAIDRLTLCRPVLVDAITTTALAAS